MESSTESAQETIYFLVF